MFANKDFSDLGASVDNIAVIRSALVRSFGNEAGRVAERQLAKGVHEPKMAVLWTMIADRLRG